MTAMFPDSGVPPTDAKNSLPDPNTVGCSELWYSTSRCQPRFDPAAANAMLSELINAVNCAGIPYDCSKLTNLCDAIAYTIQNGDSNCLTLQGGTLDYFGDLHPPLLAYPPDCCMLLKAIPNVRNSGPVRISVNNLGLVPVVRNDGQPLEAGDINPGIPFLIVLCGGRFVVPGLVGSQVPLIVKGGIVVWIRTDGNDTTGDGTENTPAKAFRTIKAAWAAVGLKYAATPVFSIGFRLGIPGTYEGAVISSFGGAVSLTGDPANPAAYRLSSIDVGNRRCSNMWVSAIGNMWFNGITFVIDTPTSATFVGCQALRIGGASVGFNSCNFEAVVSVGSGGFSGFIGLDTGSAGMAHGPINFVGNGHTVGYLVSVGAGGFWPGGFQEDKTNITVANFVFADACLSLSNLGVMTWGNNTNVSITNCTGMKYYVNNNSVLNGAGQPIPGSVDGVTASGGVFNP